MRILAVKYRGVTDVKRELLDMAGDMQELAEKYSKVPELSKFHSEIADALVECGKKLSKLGVY